MVVGPGPYAEQRCSVSQGHRNSCYLKERSGDLDMKMQVYGKHPVFTWILVYWGWLGRELMAWEAGSKALPRSLSGLYSEFIF